MTSPSENRKETLRVLRATRREMSAAPFLLRMSRQPIEVRKDAAVKRLDVEQAILALGNAELGSIRDKLIENEQELVEGREALEGALEQLNRVKSFLTTLSTVLGTVGKVVKFVSTV